MAIVIKPDGEQVTVAPENKRTGFSLEELYQYTECNQVEVIKLADGRLMVVDEDGLYKRDAKVNAEATKLFLAPGIPRRPQSIVGTVVVCDRKEIK